jgi:hypothetical protein
MAKERAVRPDDRVPYLDEIDPLIEESAPDTPITAEDIAHAEERLQAGRERGEYTDLRESDLVVLAHLTREQWQQVKRNPTLLPRILAPTAHA